MYPKSESGEPSTNARIDLPPTSPGCSTLCRALETLRGVTLTVPAPPIGAPSAPRPPVVRIMPYSSVPSIPCVRFGC